MAVEAQPGAVETIEEGLRVDRPVHPSGPEHTPAKKGRVKQTAGERVLVGAVMIPVIAILGALVLVIYLSFRENGLPQGSLTLQNYIDVWADNFVLTAFKNTLVFSGVTVAVSLIIGAPLAWLVERTDLGGRGSINTVMVLRLLIPGFFAAMGWVFMFHPRVGILNEWLMDLFNLGSPPINVISLQGMGVVQGLGLSALIYVMVGGALRAMDSSLEESGRMCGASTFQVMRRITFPLMWPSVLGASLFIVGISIAAFDVPLIIGLGNNIIVFSTYVYLVSNPVGGLPEYGIAAAFSGAMIVLALTFSWWYTRVLAKGRNYAVVTGKGYSPSLVRLGKWRPVARGAVIAYFLISTLVPLLMLVWVSLIPFLQTPSADAFDKVSLDNYRDVDWELVRRGFWNTAKIMVAAPTLAVICSLLFSWVVLRSRLKRRLAFDFVAFMPSAIPNIVFALGGLFLALYWTQGWYDLYGTVTLMVLVLGFTSVAFSTRILNASLLQISGELEEAAAMSGAATFSVLRRITLPLLWPTILYIWMWMSILAFRELTVTALLATGDNLPLSVVTYSVFSTGEVGQSSAISVVMILLLMPLTAVYMWVTRKSGISPRGG